MSRVLVISAFIAGLCAVHGAYGAQVVWNTSPGVADTEVSAIGTQVFGYFFNSTANRPSAVVVNGVLFVRQTGSTAPAGLSFSGSYNNPEDVDLYQVPLTASNAGLDSILDGQNWGGPAPLSLTGLVPGQQYEVQFMLSDDRVAFLNNRNYDVSDSNDAEGLRDVERAYHSTRGAGVPAGAPAGSRDAKIFTGTFTADPGGTQDIYNILYEGTDHTGGNSGSQVNAIQVRLIPEPATFGLLTVAAGFGLLGAGRRRRPRCC